MSKSVLSTVNDVMSKLPLEERIKQPLYLKLIAMKVQTRMEMISKVFGAGHHVLTSPTGHFGDVRPVQKHAS